MIADIFNCETVPVKGEGAALVLQFMQHGYGKMKMVLAVIYLN